MTIQMFKESLIGKYDGISPATLLPIGSISGGMNIRRIGDFGGWKSRKGAALHNTTAISAHEIKSLLHYIHPRNLDSHFFAHINNKIYEMTNDPPTAGAGTGTDLGVATVNNQIIGDIVSDLLFIGDGGGSPLTWGGNTPFCIGFLLSTTFIAADYTRWVVDGRTDTYATIPGNVSDKLYVCCSERAKGIKLTLGGTVNSNAITATVKAWRAGAWTGVSGQSDGTVVGSATLAQTGTITWTFSASDLLLCSNGIEGYWYEISFSGALTAGVKITACQVVYDMQRMTNKWNGVHEWVGAVRLFDGTIYLEKTQAVTNESTSLYMDIGGMTTSSFIYIKTPEPITGIGFGIDSDYENVADAEIDLVELWDGDSWVEISTINDGTQIGVASFAQSADISWDASAYAPAVRRIFDWDSIPGYWYRVSWDATLTDEVRVWGMTYIPYPEALATTDGCIEFKGRLFVWGDPEFPNRLRYSAKGKPDCFSGSDSGYTEQLGNLSKIRNVKRFYNELLIYKEHEVYLLEGYSPETFGSLKLSDTTGLASVSSLDVVESGIPIMHANEVLSVAIWLDMDGVYMIDGRKPRKVSLPVDQFFNPEQSTCLSAANMQTRRAFIDRSNNEYHLLLPDGELVYNYVRDEWYPKWERYIDLTCGLAFRGNDGRFYTYGGTATGFIYRLESGLVDKDTSNVDQLVSASIKTRAIAASQKQTTTLRFTFRKLWIEAKQVAGGSVITKIYPDLASSGTTLSIPTTMSLERTNYGLAVPHLYDRQESMDCMILEFISTGCILEIYSILYEVDAVGEMFNVV